MLKPGAWCAVFAGSRTQDLMTLSLRLAGFEVKDVGMWLYGTGFPKSLNVAKAIRAALDVEAPEWEDFGTALKPAYEPFILCRKPLEGTYAQNITRYGVGALNIGACRIPTGESLEGARGRCFLMSGMAVFPPVPSGYRRSGAVASEYPP